MGKIEELIAQLCPNGVEYKKLGEIATIYRGGSFQKKHFVDNGVPCIHYGQIYTQYKLFATSTISFIDEDTAQKQRFAHTNDIIMAVTSENIDDVCKCVVWLGEEDVAISGHTAIIHHTINPKYLAYFFQSSYFFSQKKKLAHGTKVIEVTPRKLEAIELPVPPLVIQDEVVRIMDCLSEMRYELQKELYAEIEDRNKQYRFYLDRVLTF